MSLRPEIRIDVYSHNLKVSRYNTQRGREAMLDFCKGLVEYGLKMVGPRKFIREMIRVYAAATKDRSEFRFHRNQLDELLEHLKNWNYQEGQVEVVHHPLYTPEPVTFNMDKNFVARDYQIKPIEYLIDDNENTKILVVQTGKGKSLTDESNVLTPTGWVKMKHIKVDDTIIAWDGTHTKVMGTYPQGIEDVYEVELYEGGSVTVSGDHLWRILESRRLSPSGTRITDTLSIRDSLKEGHSVHLPALRGKHNDQLVWCAVKRVTYVGEAPTRCIEIEHPDKLFVTDSYIVTHNTAMSLAALAQIKTRVALIIKGMYVDKWISDVREMYGLKPGEIMVVRGSKDLINIIELAKAGELDAKFIIITNKTLYNYFKAYEGGNLESVGYGCKPEELFEVLRVGVRQIDEVHQDFHLNFRIDLYTHVPKTISLSATMESDDKFINRMYELMFPPSIRFHGIAYDKYISVQALFYKAEDIRKIRYVGRRKSYSHVQFEQSLMKQKRLLKKYMDLISLVVNKSYLRKREKGQKMLIFCATVDMCTLVRDHLERTLEQEKLDIRRYVSEDSYDNLLEADVIVSTIKSAGTAVDIPHLRTCFMTDALFSRQANEQTVGRLRRLKKWPDVTPEFIYLVCEDIPQHIRYHQHKENVLADKVLTQKTFNLGTRL